MIERLRKPWPDHRAERLLGAVSLLIGVGVIAIVVFVAKRAWPLFEHNGLSWVLGGGDFETEINKMTPRRATRRRPCFTCARGR